ncbi:glycosyl transferase family 2 [Streptomyces sp. TLI_235]|nr:glycosyltransferase [Streptomyces sp. TLI_235]PBC76579.1 glycosyl transferase family 2 [Streptomyces sp. TLI_235]
MMTPAAAVLPDPPATIVDLDLAHPSELKVPGGAAAPPPAGGPVLALVRRHSHPLGMVTVTAAPGDTSGLRAALLAAGTALGATPATPPPAAAALPSLTVIVCTRDRTELLPPCLDALLQAAPADAELLLVDNAPSDLATHDLIRDRYADRIRYLCEPAPGVSRARNAGLAAATGEVCAFTDDDTLPDPGWLRALLETFRADARIGCVTGLVLPAELDTPSQVAFELHCGFSRGFAPRIWSLADQGGDPPVPYTVSRFGTGANMAFRTEALRAVGGFDEATGAGTPTRGGEDLLAFLGVLTTGRLVAYAPDALVWHRHRRTPSALRSQVYGYGVGYGAFLAAVVAHRPAMLADLVRGLPAMLPLAPGRRRPDSTPAPRELVRLQCRGLLVGPFSYLVSRRRRRTHGGGRP